MTKINWSFTVTRAGEVLATGALSTFDLSFPARMLEQIASEYGACHMTVRDGHGQIWEKDWE